MAVKFTASTSSASGQNSILAGSIGKGGNQSLNKVNSKFAKAKEERKSPSAERAGTEDGRMSKEDRHKLLTEKELADDEEGTLTQGMEYVLEKDELAEQAEADRKRHEAAVGNESGGSWQNDLNTEKEKRRDIEDTVDELKKELGWQRESLARNCHTIGKVANAGLQQAERADTVTIFIIKKEGEKARVIVRHTESCRR